MNARNHNDLTEIATYARASTFEDHPTELPYQVVGEKYRLIRRIGTGGMGDVYLAEHTVIGKRVAVKFLKRELASVSNHAARFLLEARAASSIRHENVVDITDFGRTPDEQPFFVMELLEGESLRDLLQREGRLPWDRARDLILQVLDGLTAAHEKNVVHRDIKPENCFCTTEPGRKTHVRLLDFSIAKLIGVDAASLTSTGAPIGTVYYMSPEQARGEKDIDPRTDIYSTGVMLFEMLSGEVPFNADNIYGVLYKIVNETPPPVELVDSDARLRRGIQELLRRALAKDRSERFSSTSEFRQAIEAVRASDDHNLGHATTMFAADLTPHSHTPTTSLNVADTRRALAKPGVLAVAFAVLGLLWASQKFGREEAKSSANPQVDTPKEPESSEPPRPLPEPLSASSEVKATEGAMLPVPVPVPVPAPAPAPETKTLDTASRSERAPSILPERRSDPLIKRGLRAIEKKIQACQEYALGDSVEVVFTIAPGGTVTTSEAQGLHRTSPLGTCVATAVQSARFVPASKDQRVTKTYTF